MSDQDAKVEEFWRSWFTTGAYESDKRKRHMFSLLPGAPRCKFCNAPFQGIGAPLVRVLYGKRPSNLNPLYCNICDDFARQFKGGAEVEMSMLFADVRGSTALSETMRPIEFSKLINRFYARASDVLARSDAFLGGLSGDAVAGYWGAGVAGPDYVTRSVEAARDLLLVTGHADPDGPWAPVGVGVHAGVAFYGAMGAAEGTFEITAVGEEVNLAARLASEAGAGEIVISKAVIEAAGLDAGSLEQRELTLKGISQPVTAHVIKVTPAESG